MPWVLDRGFTVVEQHDWLRPLRGDWLMRLEEAVLEAPEEVVLVAHGLGCHLVAAWAAHSQQTARVRAALLVSPPHLQTPALKQALPSWSSVVRQRLPFKAVVVGCEEFAQGGLSSAQERALDWGAPWVNAGLAAHIQTPSTPGGWPQGLALLNELMKD